MALRSEKERSGQSILIDSMNVKKVLRKIFRTLSLLVQRRGTPKKGHPCVSRPSASLDGHMLAGTIRTRCAQTASRSVPLSCTRLGCNTRDLKPKTKNRKF